MSQPVITIPRDQDEQTWEPLRAVLREQSAGQEQAGTDGQDEGEATLCANCRVAAHFLM